MIACLVMLIYVAVVLLNAESVQATNRKCVDCEGYSDEKCGKNLDYPGGVSCKSAASNQCYKEVLWDPTVGKEICKVSIVLK